MLEILYDCGDVANQVRPQQVVRGALTKLFLHRLGDCSGFVILAESQVSMVDHVFFIHLCLLQRLGDAIAQMEVLIVVPSGFSEDLARRTT